MLRQLTRQDIPETMAFLGQESSFNLFIIGDIENYGMETDFQRLWGEFGTNSELKAVLLRYFDSWVFYAPGGYDATGFSRLIMEQGGGRLLSGKSQATARLAAALGLPDSAVEPTFFARLTTVEVPVSEAEARVKKAVPEDIDRIMDLYGVITEFVSSPSRDSLLQTLSTRTGRCCFIENKEGRLIAMANSSAENSRSAMVVGVCTRPGHRRNGLASACVTRLCRDITAEHKEACLFYSNPEAGRIYKRLGFQDIGTWSMYRLGNRT